MKISIVTTLYYSAPYIQAFCERIIKSISKDFTDFEIILVDDGSPDSSLDIAIDIQKSIPQIKIIELSRNFGHHKAMLTGIEHAIGDFIFSLDIDLEEKPELLESFWNEYKKDTAVDMIYGVVATRKGGAFEKHSGQLFFNILNKLSNVDIPANTLMAKFMTKQFAAELIRFKDKNVFLGGLTVLTGFTQKPILCEKFHKGSTTYSFNLKLSQAINSFTSLSSKPLYIISFIGAVISLVSFLFITYLLINKLLFANPVSGWTSTIISIYFMGGMLLLGIGVLGVYIGKIFEEVKDRPYTIVKRIWEDK